jgi:hypothetical protein
MTDTSYYAARLYSHTDKRKLVKLGSIPFSTHERAQDWVEFLEETEPHENKWFVMQAPTRM